MLSAKQFYYSIASKTVAAVEKQLRQKNVLEKIHAAAEQGKSEVCIEEKLLHNERVWLENAGFEINAFNHVIKWSQCFSQSLDLNNHKATDNGCNNQEKDESDEEQDDSDEENNDSDEEKDDDTQENSEEFN